MAKPSQVRQYLAYWLQLGKKVSSVNHTVALSPQSVFRGEHYTQEFEEFWQQVQSSSRAKEWYLQGTDQTIAELLEPTWEITPCPRCPMPVPRKVQGITSEPCPCHDLPTWPNMETPSPRSPITNNTELLAIRDRLHQMAERTDLYAASVVESFSPERLSATKRDRLRRQSELILNSAGEGIFGVDLQMRATFINPAAAKMLGYDEGELLGQFMQVILIPVQEDACPMLTSTPFPLWATLQHQTVEYATEATFWRKDGSSFPVEYISAPMRQHGEMIGAVVTFKDITDRLQIERLKHELVSIVSHELRTPLTSIRGALGLLASGLLSEKPENAQRMLEIAVNNTDRLLRLVNDILDLERLDSGKLSFGPQPWDMGQLMLEAGDAMQAMAQKAGVNLCVEPVNAQVWVDRDRIVQLLINLLSNGIKFSPLGGTVWLRAQEISDPSAKILSREKIAPPLSPNPLLRSDRVLRVEVQDQGRGIPPDQLESIFERFQQVNLADAQNYSGTGLGLAICRQIIEQHGGRIWAESQLGQGSRFSLTLPLLGISEKPLV